MTHLGDTISALVDGELGGIELDRANAHLATCATCRAEAAQLRALKRKLRTLGEMDGADALTGRLLAMADPSGTLAARRLRRQPDGGGGRRGRGGHGRRARRRRGRYVLLGAASLVVVGIGAAAFGMGGSSGGNEPQITPQLEVFDMQHAITSGDVPFADPTPTDAPAEPPTKGPAKLPTASPTVAARP